MDRLRRIHSPAAALADKLDSAFGGVFPDQLRDQVNWWENELDDVARDWYRQRLAYAQLRALVDIAEQLRGVRANGRDMGESLDVMVKLAREGREPPAEAAVRDDHDRPHIDGPPRPQPQLVETDTALQPEVDAPTDAGPPDEEARRGRRSDG